MAIPVGAEGALQPAGLAPRRGTAVPTAAEGFAALMAGMAGGITRMVSVQWEMEPCIIECAQGGGTKKGSPDTKGFPDKKIEQVMGIEPTYLAWKASVLPLNYTCMKSIYLIIIGVTGFEPATSWSQTRRSSQAEPHPGAGII